MRDLSELTEHEAELVSRLIEAYPAALGYTRERDEPVCEVATALVEERVERTELAEGIAYRLSAVVGPASSAATKWWTSSLSVAPQRVQRPPSRSSTRARTCWAPRSCHALFEGDRS